MATTALDVRNTFGKTDLPVSPLGFGGAPIGVMATEQQRVADVLHALLDHGVNLIDTAACYRGSEEVIGNAIGSRRDEYVLISKCGHAIDAGDSRTNFSPDVIHESIDRSLQRLQTNYLDVILLHSCDLATLKQGDALAAAIDAREAGKVRFVGYSGDNDAAVYATTMDDIAVLQTSVSICDQVNIDSAIMSALENNVGVMAKRPIANAAWKKFDDQYESYKNYARPYHQRFEKMGLSLDDFEVDTWAELALRFTLSHAGVHTAIIGTTDPKHVAANITATRKGPLSEDAIKKIRAAFDDANPGDWEGLI